MSERILSVDGLRTVFKTNQGDVTAVDGVSFDVDEGEIVGIVGESGSGKTVTAKSILRLIRSPGEITDGTIEFRGENVLEFDEQRLREARGRDTGMVFQNVSNSFNPTKTVWWQLRNIVEQNTDLESDLPSLFSRLKGDAAHPRDEIDEAIAELFTDVGIPGGSERREDYPHEFSGGMLQRSLIAMVLGCKPDLIIADEPTTNLDVTVEAQILKLLWKLRQELGTTILFITHDLGVVSELCDRVIVMYSGRIVEEGPLEDIFDAPKHPYTQGLLRSIPRLDSDEEFLTQIDGTVPSPLDLPAGCRFAPRCPAATEECHEIDPEMRTVGNGTTACHLYPSDGSASQQEEVNFDE
ncbi:ABC transporter ATP-binding protein [Haloarchaeobius sp. TZWWS8]|uniref:ABC transporter ATP-binding protein n=1 Tax=Haloarchaeobius sp. TZWWS8 TaxID=3446121 RepID=UPI003EC150AC